MKPSIRTPFSTHLGFLGLSLLALAGPVPALAQDVPQIGAPAQSAYAPAQLDQMLAPVALYPDTLLTDILTAATYPLEVVEAERWVSQPSNASLSGDQLTAALQDQNWDPSVKSLVPFPAILQMMSEQLDWTQQLGSAFIAQQADVMNEVQHLRQQAEANGKLTSTPSENVVADNGAVEIQPTDPNAIPVPAYNPSVVYGSWPYPDYPPDYFVPPGYGPQGFGDPGYPGYDGYAGLDSGIYWGAPVLVAGGVFFWGGFDWHHHNIHIDRDRFNRLNSFHPFVSGTIWQHDPSHRRGVAYSTPQLQARFQPNRLSTPMQVSEFRGFDRPAAPIPQVVRPESVVTAMRPNAQAPMPVQRSFAPAERFNGGPGAQFHPGWQAPARNQPVERAPANFRQAPQMQMRAPSAPAPSHAAASSFRGQADRGGQGDRR